MARNLTLRRYALSHGVGRSVKRGGAVTAFISMMAAVALLPEVNARYPQDALWCLASLKEPEGLLICPEHRNGYCVKEVSDLAEEDCGRTTYFGDKWNAQTGKCEYRKCEATCLESSWDFEFEGEAYERNRFCCDFNYCNGTSRQFSRTGMSAWISGVVALLLTLLYRREEQAG
ncbi:unnamed protein product [Ectocarpus sp. 8 AP-2014]